MYFKVVFSFILELRSTTINMYQILSRYEITGTGYTLNMEIDNR